MSVEYGSRFSCCRNPAFVTVDDKPVTFMQDGNDVVQEFLIDGAHSRSVQLIGYDSLLLRWHHGARV